LINFEDFGDVCECGHFEVVHDPTFELADTFCLSWIEQVASPIPLRRHYLRTYVPCDCNEFRPVEEEEEE
jgi:hypothetical protein